MELGGHRTSLLMLPRTLPGYMVTATILWEEKLEKANRNGAWLPLVHIWKKTGKAINQDGSTIPKYHEYFFPV